MACNFDITFKSTAAAVIANAKTKVAAAGGTFEGNTSSGSFTVPITLGHIDGSYTIKVNVMTVDITHQPFLISCNRIQTYLEENIVE